MAENDEDIGVEAIYWHPYDGEMRKRIWSSLGENGLIHICCGEVFIEMSPLAAKGFLEDLAEATGESVDQLTRRNPSGDESAKAMSTKERNTLLVLIAALCKEAKVDYKQRGISIAIKAMTEQIGAPISDDTIRRVFGQIDDALDLKTN